MLQSQRLVTRANTSRQGRVCLAPPGKFPPWAELRVRRVQPVLMLTMGSAKSVTGMNTHPHPGRRRVLYAQPVVWVAAVIPRAVHRFATRDARRVMVPGPIRGPGRADVPEQLPMLAMASASNAEVIAIVPQARYVAAMLAYARLTGQFSQGRLASLAKPTRTAHRAKSAAAIHVSIQRPFTRVRMPPSGPSANPH